MDLRYTPPPNKELHCPPFVCRGKWSQWGLRGLMMALTTRDDLELLKKSSVAMMMNMMMSLYSSMKDAKMLGKPPNFISLAIQGIKGVLSLEL
ncbi:hypothetical protein Tco_1492011 [Tanacetum coccineum]